MLKKRKQRRRRRKLKGRGFHVSPVQTSEITGKLLLIEYATPTQINILLYLHTGTYYFRDPPYLKSPSHKAGSQRTSCERNKAINLISVSAFPKESSFKVSEVFSKNPIKRAMKGKLRASDNISKVIKKHCFSIPCKSNLFVDWIHVSFLLHFTLIDAYYYLLTCVCVYANTQTHRPKQKGISLCILFILSISSF